MPRITFAKIGVCLNLAGFAAGLSLDGGLGLALISFIIMIYCASQI